MNINVYNYLLTELCSIIVIILSRHLSTYIFNRDGSNIPIFRLSRCRCTFVAFTHKFICMNILCLPFYRRDEEFAFMVDIVQACYNRVSWTRHPQLVPSKTKVYNTAVVQLILRPSYNIYYVMLLCSIASISYRIFQHVCK